MPDQIDMSDVFAKAASDRASGKLLYTPDGKPFVIPTYGEQEAQRQSYAAGQEARRATELLQRQQQINATSAQRGERLLFPEAGMPRPGTFEAPTDFRTPVKTPPAPIKFSLPELPKIPSGVSQGASKFAGPAARALAPLTRVLGPLADLAGAANAAKQAFDSAKSLPGYAQDALAAGNDREKLKALRRKRLADDPSQLTLPDEAMGLNPKKDKSSNLPDHLEPRGQRRHSIPFGTPGYTYLLTITLKIKFQPTSTGDVVATAPFSITTRGGSGGTTLWFLTDANGDRGILDAGQESVESPPAIIAALRSDGVPEPPPSTQPGDEPSIPTNAPAPVNPSPAPAPRPAPRHTPAPNQAPAPSASPFPSGRPAPRLAPSPVPTPTPNATPTPAPAEQPQSTPGQSPSPGGGATLRSPSLNPDKFPDTTLQGENEPLRAPSINPDRFPDPPSSRQPDPGTPNSPSESPGPVIDPTAQPKTNEPPPPTPTNQRQCEDPCIAEMQAQQDKNKPVEITVKVFKACKTDAATPTTPTTPTTPATSDSSNAIFEDKNIKVPALEADNYKLLYERIAKLEAQQCDKRTDAIASVPEWWQLRAEGQRPQLVVIFGEVLGTGKLTTSRWSLTIPHYNRPKGFKPRIPDYNKGNFEGILTLTDNSKIIVNANSEMECKRVINALKILIDAKYRTKDGKAIKAKVGERLNSDFKQCKVTPVRADFYSTGAKNMQPDYSVNMRTK